MSTDFHRHTRPDDVQQPDHTPAQPNKPESFAEVALRLGGAVGGRSQTDRRARHGR
ncbi:hypothetical protein [Rhodopirellula sallentina]|uniref:hypothetical protein n=1 Tax=Rhodopirellula sallentina TaxID=1263869 RepID=UPI001F341E11|nr:hypothetical protein [Rhodopirellula sallentina]